MVGRGRWWERKERGGKWELVGVSACNWKQIGIIGVGWYMRVMGVSGSKFG